MERIALRAEAEKLARKHCSLPTYTPVVYGVAGALLCAVVLTLVEARAAFDFWLSMEALAIGFAIPYSISWLQQREYYKRVEAEYQKLSEPR